MNKQNLQDLQQNHFNGQELDPDAQEVKREIMYPIYPTSYIYDPEAIRIAEHYPPPELIRGPIHEAGLSIAQCLQECFNDAWCTSVGFPGCYLLNLTGFTW